MMTEAGITMRFGDFNIDESSATLGYLHSWATHLINNAGVKLIPLGQTTGQELLLQLHPTLETTVQTVLHLSDDELYTCSWGLRLASLQHGTQYTGKDLFDLGIVTA
jgi:urease accessory protein